MFSTWLLKYEATNGQSGLAGWSFESEAECINYFAERVKAKIQYANPASFLQEYLVEMTETGFDTTALQAQVENPPRLRDWEIGEAFAEAMLEDSFDASFPWPTAWDKRTPRASLPGPDVAGFHKKQAPQFLFGEIKSSSEAKCPPQVVNSGDDCLRNQVKRLLESEPHRLQLIEWLLVRAKNSARWDRWRPIFDEAMKYYAGGKASVCGILVRGGINPDIKDLSSVQDELVGSAGAFDLILLAFYLPFDKSKWVELIYGTGGVH